MKKHPAAIAVLVGALATVVALAATSALAGTGVGGVFNLGKTNSVNAASSLTGKTSAAQLNVANTGTGAGIVGKSSSATAAGATARSSANASRSTATTSMPTSLQAAT